MCAKVPFLRSFTAYSGSEKSVLSLNKNGAKLFGSSCKHRKKEEPDNEQGTGEGLGVSGIERSAALRTQRKDMSRLEGGEGRARGRMWRLSLPSLHCQPGPPPLQFLSHLGLHIWHSFRPEGPFPHCTRQNLSFRYWSNSLFFLKVFLDALVWVKLCSIFP